MIRRQQPQRAMVIVIVVYLIAGLSILAFALAFRSRIAIKESVLLVERLQQDQLALAAYEQACGILAIDDANIDSHNELWSSWHEMEPVGALDQPATDETQWLVYWRLTDESAKINVNLASVDLLLGLKCLDKAVIASIIDWIDLDVVPNPDGAENDYYSSLESGYSCKNGPIDHLEELLLIKGITPQVYYGSNLEGQNNYMDHGNMDLSELEDVEFQNNTLGLSDLLTVYGDGRININTASSDVLYAIPMLSESAINEIISRQKSTSIKFRTIDDIESNDSFTAADRLTLKQIAKFSSNHFKLHTWVHKIPTPSWCYYIAVIERQAGNIRLLSWQRGPRAKLKDILLFNTSGDKHEYHKALNDALF